MSYCADLLAMNSQWFVFPKMSLFYFKLFLARLCCGALLRFPQTFRKSLFYKKPCYGCLGQCGENVCMGQKALPREDHTAGPAGTENRSSCS